MVLVDAEVDYIINLFLCIRNEVLYMVCLKRE